MQQMLEVSSVHWLILGKSLRIPSPNRMPSIEVESLGLVTSCLLQLEILLAASDSTINQNSRTRMCPPL